MSPLPVAHDAHGKRKVVSKPSDPDGLILEAWAQGYMVGSLLIMAFLTMANMRRGVLLHKLIFLELVLGIWQGFWLFFDAPVYAWWLSVGAIFLNASWTLHNVISWMKIKPFLSRPGSIAFIGSVILVQPYWVVEIYANFAYFHGINDIFKKTRPWEALCRDPWWILTTVMLVWTIKTQYELTLKEIVKISPRFGIMLLSMGLSIIFIILDICSVTNAFKSSLPVGINPFWKLAFVFKCLTDMVVLDDFKTALDRLRAFKISRIGSFCQDDSDRRNWNDGNLVNTWDQMAAESHSDPVLGRTSSPDGTLLNPTSSYPFDTPRPQHQRKRSSKPNGRETDEPSPAYTPRDFGSMDQGPESMVPSALYSTQSDRSPLKPMPTAHMHENIHGNSPGNRDSTRLEAAYARAMREVQGQGPSVDYTNSTASSTAG